LQNAWAGLSGNLREWKEGSMRKYALIKLLGILLSGLICLPAMAADLVVSFSGGAAGDAVKKCYIEPFEKSTGAQVVFEASPNFAKLKAMVKSGNVIWDLAEGFSQEQVVLAGNEGLLEPIDYSKIDTSTVYETALTKYGLGKAFYSTVLGYNSAKYPDGKHPKSWKDFWDVKKFPGRRALRNAPENNLEFALMADGVPPDKLYPLDIDRAFKSLDRIKPYITVWWTSGAQPAQLLTDGEVDMASAWNGRLWAVQKEGAKVGIEWNEGVLMLSSWVIPKGAPHKKTALEFLNFSLNPKLQACYANTVGYPGLSKEAFKYIDPKISPNLPTYPENYKKQVLMNYDWWLHNREKVEELWNKWILK
jgi:putative spermidine/putrescine transport system substrate-binding protein